ncbi:hypothetical protein [Roseibium sediminis]|uniref:hypothetical protein n=1 Tax=Roseibium sediminis TaxID=1775174 RepID=UPI00123CF2E5|nr:hypothetical protein [Roseibium sediminis]
MSGNNNRPLDVLFAEYEAEKERELASLTPEQAAQAVTRHEALRQRNLEKYRRVGLVDENGDFLPDEHCSDEEE